MPRAALAVVLSALVAACGQPSQTAEPTSGPALDFIEATPIDEGALIEGPAFPRPVVTPAVATSAPAAEKAADKEEEPETAVPAKSADRAGEAVALTPVAAPSPPARQAPAPRPAADEAVPAANRAPAPVEPAGQVADLAASPQPDVPN